MTALIKDGDVASLQLLLDKEPARLYEPVDGAPSPILLALYHGQHSVAEMLRERKRDLDVFEAAAMGDLHQLDRVLAEDPEAVGRLSEDGFSPLGYAAFFGHFEALKKLVAAGADPNEASQNDLQVMPLHSSLAGGHKEAARYLIVHGADVDAPAGGGWTPLHYVAASNNIETARLLLAKGARTDVARDDGMTPAEVAEELSFTDLAALLTPHL